MNATHIDLCQTPNESTYELAKRFLLTCVAAETANHASVIVHNGHYLPETSALYRMRSQATQELNLDTLRENIVDMCTVTHKGKKNYTGTCTHPTFYGLFTVGHMYTPKGALEAETRPAVAHRMASQVGKVRAEFFPNVKSADKDTRDANWNQFKLWARDAHVGAGEWYDAENKEAMMYLGSQNVKAVMNYVKPATVAATPVAAAAPVAAPVSAPVTAPANAELIAYLAANGIQTTAPVQVAAPIPVVPTSADAELLQMLATAGIGIDAPVAAPVQVSDKASLIAQVVEAGHMSKSLAERTSVETLTILANLQ